MHEDVAGTIVTSAGAYLRGDQLRRLLRFARADIRLLRLGTDV
jgi:hypothetical protein